MTASRKNFLLTENELALLERFKRELGWSHTDSIKLGLAALSALLLEGGDARKQLADGRQVVSLRIGEGATRRALTFVERDDASGRFYLGMESGPAVWAGEQPPPPISTRFGPTEPSDK